MAEAANRIVDDLLTGQRALPPAPPARGGGRIVDELLAGQSLRSADPRVKWGDAPDYDTVDRAAPILTTLRASLAPETEDQIKRFAAARGIPVDRYGVLGGNIVYTDENGRIQREVPSVTGARGPADAIGRAFRWFAAQVGPSIPQAAGGIAATLAPGGPIASPVVAGGAGAAVDVVRQLLDRALAGESLSPGEVDYLNSLGQGAMAATGTSLGRGAARLTERNPLGVSAYDRTQAMTPQARQEAMRLAADARARGIDLTTGQATGLPSLMQRERQLGRDQATTDMMAARRTLQRNEQVPRAIEAEIGQIAPGGQEARIQAFRQGAQDIVADAEQARRMTAAPLYEQAFEANQSIASAAIDRILETPAGRRALKRASEKMQNDRSPMGTRDPDLTEQARDAVLLGKMAEGSVPREGVAAGLNLRSLDYVKRALWDMREEAARAGSNDDARILDGLRRALVREIDAADVTARAGPNSLRPEGGLYRQARAAYGDASDALEAVERGGVGFLNSITGMDRQNIVTRVFGAGNIMPNDIASMRFQFEKGKRLADWNAGLAAFLSDKLDDAMKVGASGERGNVASKFAANVWGDDRQKRVIIAALGGDGTARAQGMEALIKVLNAAAKSLPDGSPTATDLMALQAGETVGTGLRVAGKALSPGTYLNLGSELVEGIAQLRAPETRRRLAEALLSGQVDSQLRQLRLLSPASKKAAALTGQVLTQIGIGVSGATTPLDREPPAARGATPASRQQP